MSTSLTRRQTPKERELENKRIQLAVLEAELAQGELDLATFKTELTIFETRYLHEVGVLYAERLAKLTPGAGHLVPMPTHIYKTERGSLLRTPLAQHC